MARGLLFTALAILALLSPFLFQAGKTSSVQLQLPSGTPVRLEVADTETAREKGLGGRSSLPQDEGMLFKFDEPITACMWMKDMRFPLDMLWLNGSKQVIYMAQDVAPSTYPKQFCSSSVATYVIELDAGQAKALHISPGQTLKF